MIKRQIFFFLLYYGYTIGLVPLKITSGFIYKPSCLHFEWRHSNLPCWTPPCSPTMVQHRGQLFSWFLMYQDQHKRWPSFTSCFETVKQHLHRFRLIVLSLYFFFHGHSNMSLHTTCAVSSPRTILIFKIVTLLSICPTVITLGTFLIFYFIYFL